MTRRKVFFDVLRVLCSLALLYYAYTLIRFDDVHVLRHGSERIESKDLRDEGDHWRAGERRIPKTGTEVTREEGFLSLFRRLDRRTYFLFGPLLLVAMALTAWRWKLLLHAEGFPAPYRTVLGVSYIGLFFNNFLPGSVGGDVARAMIAGKGEERKAALVGTILLDRLIGLGSMILIAALCLIPFARDASMDVPVYLVSALLAAMVAGYALYFSPVVRRLPWFRREGRVGAIVRELDGTFQLLQRRKAVVARCVLISIIGQSIAFVATWGLAQALGVGGVRLSHFFVYQPIVSLIVAIPISAGGWGVQEHAYKTLFGMAGVPANEAIAISILFKLTLIFLSLPGGVLWALGVARSRRKSAAELALESPPQHG